MMNGCEEVGDPDSQMDEIFENFHWMAKRFKQLQHLKMNVEYLHEVYSEQLGVFQELEIPGAHNFNGALKSMSLEFLFGEEYMDFDLDKMVESLAAHPDFCKLQWDQYTDEEYVTITGSFGKDETVEKENWPRETSDERLKKYLEKPKGQKRKLDS